MKGNPARLQYSALEKHQHEALDEHHEAGGLSLVAWHTEDEDLFLMIWPIEGFQPRKSITKDKAADLNILGVIE